MIFVVHSGCVSVWMMLSQHSQDPKDGSSKMQGSHVLLLMIN